MQKIKELFHKPPKNNKYYLIAIDGRGGSGKTTLALYLSKLLPDFTIINGDDYFEPTPGEIAWGDFNDERFEEEVIVPLKLCKTSLNYRPYDWHKKPAITEQLINITNGVLIERCYSFSFDLDWDIKIWVDTPPDISLERGQIRDEMPLEQGLNAWTLVWKPREDAYIAKIKPQQVADLVIDGTQPYEEQL